ncbi:cytochrome oxidase assembly protein-domain-containing protein [Chytriomyces sp. MP71]|nr:cytochrome oxidase assembly protein-domain-containing protein [Chytriomyces sp. MP71]
MSPLTSLWPASARLRLCRGILLNTHSLRLSTCTSLRLFTVSASTHSAGRILATVPASLAAPGSWPQRVMRSPNVSVSAATTNLVRFSTAASLSNHQTDIGAPEASAELESASITQNHAVVGWWYLFCAGLVFCIVAVGGVTRLTESGLSITEWNLIKGMKPPRTEEEWMEEFDKYKKFPEYTLLNHNITLSEFKFIFYMEWGHRMLGRFIGLSFILPGLYFASRGYMTPSIAKRSFVVACLIGGQGTLGWYMVKSGLREELFEAKQFHGVSQYWLAAHLGSAFIIYSVMLLTGLEILRTSSRGAKVLSEQVAVAFRQPGFRVFAMSTHNIAALVLLTAFSGAFVAGLDAGLIYNEFPFMGTGLVPSDMWALSDPAVSEKPIPWWRNLLENHAAVQFNHRVLAMTTATAVTFLWVASRRFTLPRSSRLAINALLGVTALQVSLGISTLLYLVPVPLAAAHQSGSLLLLSTSLWLLHTLRILPK